MQASESAPSVPKAATRRTVVFARSKVQWIPKPDFSSEAIAKGLIYLSSEDEAVFSLLDDKQGYEEIDRLTLKNTYDIRNKDGRRIFLAVVYEKPGLVFRRQWAFRLSFYDAESRRISIFNRVSTLHCCSCIESCRTHVMRGKMGKPVGPAGSIVSRCHWLRKPSFMVLDDKNNLLYRLEPLSKMDKSKFLILDKKRKKTGGEVRIVTREDYSWMSFDTNAFKISFPADAKLHVKMLLLAATVLLNVLYWDAEDKGPPPEFQPTESEEELAELLHEEMEAAEALTGEVSLLERDKNLKSTAKQKHRPGSPATVKAAYSPSAFANRDSFLSRMHINVNDGGEDDEVVAPGGMITDRGKIYESAL
ncbi:unnamed protein product [Notodromas monacha]|uniref:Phospholipid scramblase n=1 Tax=Notodromas monacha TaxID=399045 RepID=A0A7R9BHZ4_9CRUS|nr:unnamed protein product [Notodromas monacha]CAG0915062.1 unnamed protein product [Notodromas monacha]